MWRRLVLGLAALAVLSGAALLFLHSENESTFSPNPAFTEELKTMLVGDTALRVAVADSAEERTQGLSGTSALPPGTGLFFVFESDNRPGFWMKDMLFPIDIIWIARGGDVVGIEENVSPETYPRVYRPSKSIRYVLEVPAGFSALNNVQKSTKISVEMAL
jgi:uncharacterized membrane protein (UPF0127 family)